MEGWEQEDGGGRTGRCATTWGLVARSVHRNPRPPPAPQASLVTNGGRVWPGVMGAPQVCVLHVVSSSCGHRALAPSETCWGTPHPPLAAS